MSLASGARSGANRRLLLLGAGHAHLAVLQRLAREQPQACEVVLVSPLSYQLYSGMVPGCLAGHYRLEACRIDLAPLVERARLAWVQDTVAALDVRTRRVTLASGTQLDYDVLSIDTGSVAARAPWPGAEEHALPVRPLETLVERIQALDAEPPKRVTVVGTGAAGFELLLALAWRWRQHAPVLNWVGGADEPLAAYPQALRRAAHAVLKQRGVRLFKARILSMDSGSLRIVWLHDGGGHEDGLVADRTGTRNRVLPSDFNLLALGPAAPPWLGASGLTLDAGFVATGAGLQSVSHPEVFAAGDVATRQDRRHPKSGVYAVRAGPALADNVLRVLRGEAARAHLPPSRTLNLLSTGAPHALAAWGPLAWQGEWVWRWKDRIDRGFVARHSPLAAPRTQAAI